MKKLVLLFCLVLFCLTEGKTQTYLPFGSTWSYYDQGNKPSRIMGKNWERTDYNDSSWDQAPAQLGYGDGDEATVISSGVLTAYFRIDFNLTNPGNLPSYDVNLLYDDGAVIYLNGSEIGRVNMPGGNPNYSTLASSNSGDNAQVTFNVPSSSFNNGTNVFAVEVHQNSSTSTDLSFDLEVASPPPITRGPYLQNLTSSSVVVKWRTNFPTESIVRYGLSQGSILNAVSDLNLKTEHEIEITGLASDSIYFYQIENDAGIIAGPEPDMYFKIAPPIGSTPVIKAWILGDPGTANSNQRAVRDAYYNYIGADHTDLMLFLGDNAYNSGTDEEYQYAMFENMYEDKMKNTASWSCLGNHDGYTADSPTQSGPYYDIFTFPTTGEAGGVASGTEAYYSFDYGNIHFIVLESYETDRNVGGPMYNWALSDIQSTTQEWIVAIWHHPAYTKGSHDSDNVNDSAGSMQDMRENFLPILEENGVDLVMSGHSHSYERSYFVNGHYGNSTTFDPAVHTIPINGDGDGQVTGDGVYQKNICVPGSVYITTGSAGKISQANLDHPVMYYSAASLGSVVMEVDGPEMNVKFVRDNGNIDDFFTIEKTSTGNVCDDGDPCTLNDTFDASCNCVGVAQPMDTDLDGVDDCLDGCPTDPLKIAPGSCGCGFAESGDTDNDGTPDCTDGCPNDPLKTSPGICGCLKADVDADMDGICDSLCLTDLYVNPFSDQNKIYEVSNKITSDAILDNSLYMEFSAGFEIHMNAGFEIKSGASLHAYILGCTN